MPVSLVRSKLTISVPLFHAAGLYIFIHHIYYNSSVALAVDRPLSADTVAECLDNVDADATLLPPSILEDMSQSEHCIKALQKLKHVVFAGGMLTPTTSLEYHILISPQAILLVILETDLFRIM